MRKRRRRPEDEYADYYDESVREPARRQEPRKYALPPALKHLLALAIVGALFLAAIRLLAGPAMLEKTLQALIAPCGLIWLALFLCFYFALLAKNGLVAFIGLLAWLLLTFSGNMMVAGWLTYSVEAAYLDFDPSEIEPLDVALILGGGTRTSPSGRPQLGGGGDRIVQAARMFRNDQIKLLICSGTSGLPRAEGELTAAESAASLLMDLGVPAEKIVLIDGRNTMEEIQALDRWLGKQQRRDLRVGIVTSAWHMHRAIRLARTVGLDVTAIPTDFMSQPFSQRPDILVPSSQNVLTTTYILKEHLAGFVGR